VYFFYSLLLGLALLAVIPAYFVKLRILRNEPLHLRERLGFRVPNRTTVRPFLWIHAVSVGEVLSLQNLIHEIRRGHPDWEIGFSTLTNSGYKVAAAKLRDVDGLFFVPFDFGWAVRRYFKKLQPRLLVLAESEFWPRILREARRKRCPALLVNGRISDRSFKRFKRWKSIIGPLFQNIDRFLVQSRQDMERLERIGVAPYRIAVSGNLKCEVRLPLLSEEDILKSRYDLSIADDKKVIVAGSIHRGEDDLLLQAFREARKTRPDVLLVLAPRHPEKFGEIEKAFSSDSFVIRRKSQLLPGSIWDVLILDTIGDLARCYALSDAAFIGGSLIPWGGQNLLEPAFYGKPVFFGPHMENFAALADEFVRGGAARIVKNTEDLVEMFLFKDRQALQAMGLRSRDILASLQGATEKTLAAIEYFISHGHDGQ
jgi:3-deoxy-D-manno-octulosonic-acid transferase